MSVKTKSKTPKIELLSIKYKPKTLGEVVGRDEIINVLNGYLEQGLIPNLLFYGPPGVGKTLIADLFIKKYFGGASLRGNVKVVDASKDNKVENIRDIVISFMKAKSVITDKRRILLLDEFDYLSKQSQATLRRPIEEALKNCTVIATCNYVDMVIDPLKSRFTLIPCEMLEYEPVRNFVEYIITNEKIVVDGEFDDLMRQIYTYGKGELRYILNNFLELARMKKILNSNIIEFGISESKSYIELLLSGNVEKAISEAMKKPVNAFSGAIRYILDETNTKLPYGSRVKLSNMFADAIRDINGGMPYYAAVATRSHSIHYMITSAKSKPKKK